MREIYLVKICTGSQGDYFEKPHFATTDKYEADFWTERFNTLVTRRRMEIKEEMMKSEDYYPFFHSEILHDEPEAIVTKIELR